MDKAFGTAWQLYLCDRLQGRDVFAVAGSNDHGNAPLGYVTSDFSGVGAARTSAWVDRESMDWEETFGAARRGAAVLHTRAGFVEMRVYDATGAFLGQPGAIIELGDDRELRLAVRGRTAGGSIVHLFHAAEGRCPSAEELQAGVRPDVELRTIERWEVCSEAKNCEFERRAVWDEPASGLLWAQLMPAVGVRHNAAAVVAPVRIAAEEDGTVEELLGQ